MATTNDGWPLGEPNWDSLPTQPIWKQFAESDKYAFIKPEDFAKQYMLDTSGSVSETTGPGVKRLTRTTGAGRGTSLSTEELNRLDKQLTALTGTNNMTSIGLPQDTPIFMPDDLKQARRELKQRYELVTILNRDAVEIRDTKTGQVMESLEAHDAIDLGIRDAKEWFATWIEAQVINLLEGNPIEGLPPDPDVPEAGTIAPELVGSW